jgi:hypothetical protein
MRHSEIVILGIRVIISFSTHHTRRPARKKVIDPKQSGFKTSAFGYVQ